MQEPFLTNDGTFIYIGAKVFVTTSFMTPIKQRKYYDIFKGEVIKIKNNGLISMKIENEMNYIISRKNFFPFELYYSKKILEREWC